MDTKENACQSEKVQPEKKISSAKHEKAILHHFDAQCKEIKNQMNEQLKAIGERTDIQCSILYEVEDFIKKRGEVEAEHARNLEKLAKGIIQRQKGEKNKRDTWTQHATTLVWQELVDSTRIEAEERQSIANVFIKKIAPAIAIRADDLQRMSKRCRDIGILTHSEMNRVMTELQTAMKTYQIVYGEYSIAEKKMKVAEEELKRSDAANAGKNTLSRKQKNSQKILNKRLDKYRSVRLRCTKARNEYVLCVKAANSSLHKFYADDLSTLIDGADLGMDFWLQSMINTISEVRKELIMKEMNSLADLEGLRDSLDSRADKQAFFESRPTVFMLPKPFEFRPQLGDNEYEVSAQDGLAPELEQRMKQIEKRLEGLKFESEEVWKSLEASEKQLLSLYMQQDDDINKWRNDIAVTFQYYLKKLEYFMLNGNLIERLETRCKVIDNALGGSGHNDHKLVDIIRRKRRMRRVVPSMNGKPTPKLFGSSLDEYCELTGEEIPLIVTSTISYLSRFALRHQGLFRVSGSTSEINKFKEAFERGEDIVSDLTDASEINSVAGVLKLYLRELRVPPFPLFLFDQFTDCVMNTERDEKVFIQRVHDLVYRLSASSIRLLRFLFSFLSHLCEFSDENMMEPHNVAICLGPTLLPIPDGKDQVFYHNFVNALIRGMIIHHESIFPSIDVLPGIIYDKFGFAREEPFSYADDEVNEGEEDTGDEDDSRRSILDGLSIGRIIPFDITNNTRCSTVESLSNDVVDNECLSSPYRPIILSPSCSSRKGGDIICSSPSPSPLLGLHTDTSHSSYGSTSRNDRIDKKGDKDTLLTTRTIPSIQSNIPSTSTNSPLVFPSLSLRGQIHYQRKEEQTKMDNHDLPLSSSNNNTSTSSSPIPYISRPSVLPSKTNELSNELKKLFRDTGKSLEQPDVVRESVRRSSPSIPNITPLSNLSNIHSSYNSPSPISSPGHSIDQLSAMLATLND